MDPIMITNARLSFPHLVEPHAPGNNPQAKKSFSADFILEPDSADWQAVQQRIQDLAVAAWAEQAQAILQMIYQDRRQRFFGTGDEKIDKNSMQPYNGYAGKVYVSGKRDQQPQMIKTNGAAADPANTMECQQLARSMYGGCYVNAAIRPWIQDNQHGRGVRCELIAVQFSKDGEAFGEAVTDASGMFGAVQGASTAPSPAGAPVPQQPAPAFGQANAAPAPGMPTPPFGTPGMPGALGGDD